MVHLNLIHGITGEDNKRQINLVLLIHRNDQLYQKLLQNKACLGLLDPLEETARDKLLVTPKQV